MEDASCARGQCNEKDALRAPRLKESECGQMGVKRMAGTLGCTMEPPAATEYAVLPVGVASITPSACTCAHTARLAA